MAAVPAPIVEGCPAFSEGCPFSKLDIALLPQVIQEVPKEIAEKCPAFEKGCPFKEDDSVEALYKRLSEMPASHRMGQESPTPAAQRVEATLRLVHEQSKALKVKLNATCPVFATSCPFKTVTSDGQPLVQELDDVVERWGLKELEEVNRAPSPVNSEPLSKTMKAGTRSVHRAAENVRFVRDFLKGSVPRDSYIELLRALYHVYDALERAIRGLPEHLQHCDFSKLWRAETLLVDLCHYSNSEFPETPEATHRIVGVPSQVAQQYVDHLDELVTREPLLVLAHAYTRYLGDLSGGQILARAAQKAYGLESDKGTAFYNFELVGSTASEIKDFKKSYRASLDALQLNVYEADALVEEANMAFLMNMLLFEDRDVAAGHLPRVRTVEEARDLVESNRSALKFQQAYAAVNAGAGKCPFLPSSEQKGAIGAGCLWPFLWLHDPRAALVGHPYKNTCGALATAGFAKFAWELPRSAAVTALLTTLGCYYLKPKRKSAAQAAAPSHEGSGSTPAARGVCPFLPATTKSESAAPSAATEHHSSCPWPFLWLHDPRAAFVGHPCKNACSTLALTGFAKFAWEYPRHAAAGSVICALGCYSLKPKRKTESECAGCSPRASAVPRGGA